MNSKLNFHSYETSLQSRERLDFESESEQQQQQQQQNRYDDVTSQATTSSNIFSDNPQQLTLLCCDDRKHVCGSTWLVSAHTHAHTLALGVHSSSPPPTQLHQVIGTAR